MRSGGAKRPPTHALPASSTYGIGFAQFILGDRGVASLEHDALPGLGLRFRVEILQLSTKGTKGNGEKMVGPGAGEQCAPGMP